MSDGCEWCKMSPQGQNEQLTNIRTEAKKYAVQQQKQIAIIKEGYDYAFIDAATAIRENYQIVEFVSQYL